MINLRFVEKLFGITQMFDTWSNMSVLVIYCNYGRENNINQKQKSFFCPKLKNLFKLPVLSFVNSIKFSHNKAFSHYFGDSCMGMGWIELSMLLLEVEIRKRRKGWKRLLNLHFLSFCCHSVHFSKENIIIWGEQWTSSELMTSKELWVGVVQCV